MGGTEFCIIKLSEALQRLGHEVTVTGYTLNEVCNGVKYIHYDQLAQADYDIAIGANYLSFVKELQDKNITATKKIFWMHNDEYYNWYRGETMDKWKQYFNDFGLCCWCISISR